MLRRAAYAARPLCGTPNMGLMASSRGLLFDGWAVDAVLCLLHVVFEAFFFFLMKLTSTTI